MKFLLDKQQRIIENEDKLFYFWTYNLFRRFEEVYSRNIISKEEIVVGPILFWAELTNVKGYNWDIKNYICENIYMDLISTLSGYEFCCLLYSIDKYKEDKEKVIKLKKLYKLQEGFFVDIIKKIWDLERYVGIKENRLYIKLGYYKVDYKNFYSVIKDEKLSLKKGNFLDIVGEMDKYVNIYSQVNIKYYVKIEGIDYCELFDKYFNIYSGYVDFRYMEEEEFKVYIERMRENALGWRKEWEREWEEGRRDYKWESKEIKYEYKWEEIKID